MLNPRLIAIQGIGFTPIALAVQGFLLQLEEEKKNGGGSAKTKNGMATYYLYDSEQEKREKQAEIVKKQAKPKSKASDYLAKSKAGKQEDAKLSDALAVNFKPEKAPKVDATASRFIADQLALAESKAAEQIAAAIEEEEIAIAMCLM